MVREISGTYDGSDFSVAIILSEFNDFITRQLRKGALEGLEKTGVSQDKVSIYRVPGSFEIPGMAKQVLEKADHDGLVCLGAVIRGETPHFDYVCSHVTRGIGQLNLEYSVPVVFGVITTDTVQQAVERAGTKAGNKGHEAALSLIQMIHSYRSL